MKVLITGFDPFGGESINPSYEAVKLLPDRIKDSEIIKLELPTVFRKSISVLQEKIDQIQPDVVICVGQAGGRFEISVERIAINIDVARIPDNEGNQPLNTAIEVNGKNAYFSNLPINAMVTYCKQSSIPATISNTAGTYVCNHIMYGLLHLIETKYSNIRGGFIHVPFITEQVISRRNIASLPLELISKGLERCIEAALDNQVDYLEGYGETH